MRNVIVVDPRNGRASLFTAMRCGAEGGWSICTRIRSLRRRTRKRDCRGEDGDRKRAM
jgi:hypothetical protein